MSWGRIEFSVETSSATDGVTVIKVAGQFINKRGRHTFNRIIDALAPCWARTDRDRIYVIDLLEVTEIDLNGYDALEYARWRFSFCGVEKYRFCVDVARTSFKGWGERELARRSRWHNSIESALGHYNSQ